MNTSNTTLSSDSAVFDDDRFQWTVSLSEIVYFGSGFVLGCIFMFLILFLRAKCKRSKKDESDEEQEGDML